MAIKRSNGFRGAERAIASETAFRRRDERGLL
jgi:hypothetical protein